jgi:transcriptional repressor NrdR
MICPYCASVKTKVVGTVNGIRKERFRKCLACGKTFQTVEAIKFDDYWKEYARATNEDTKK